MRNRKWHTFEGCIADHFYQDDFNTPSLIMRVNTVSENSDDRRSMDLGLTVFDCADHINCSDAVS